MGSQNQRPELWRLYNTRIHLGESIRVFPLSNWTELDVWHYIAQEMIPLPSTYFAHKRRVFILRLATASSVDDGKSTLIGRLLYDSKAICIDQLESVQRASRDNGDDYLNLALLTDGLRAEREQGITIDVAYRYFTTPQRTLVHADTPSHHQYTRNMVTGASTADLAMVLVDARKGLMEQSRRHAFLATPMISTSPAAT